MTPPVSARPLADVARDIAHSAAEPAELHDTLMSSTVYFERGDRPGFSALGRPGAGAVPVYSSVEQLARARGTVGWFSLTGADALDLLPPGYDLLLDIAGDDPLRLSMSAVGRIATVTVDVSEAS